MGKKKFAAPAPKSRLSRLGPIWYFPDFTNIFSGFITILSAILPLVLVDSRAQSGYHLSKYYFVFR